MKQFANLLAAGLMLAALAGCSQDITSLLNGSLQNSIDSVVRRGRAIDTTHHDVTGGDSTNIRHDHGTDTTNVSHDSGDSTSVRHDGRDSTNVRHSGDGLGDTTHVSDHGGIDSTSHHGGRDGGGSDTTRHGGGGSGDSGSGHH